MSGLRAILVILGGAILSLSAALPARADVIDGKSQGYGAVVDITLTPLNISVPAQAQATGDAPAAYNNSNNAVAVNQTVIGLGNFTQVSASGNATSNVDGTAGNKTTTAQGQVNGAIASIDPTIFGP